MKHILLTKFAMRFAEDNPRRRYERDGWVDYRLNLFKWNCVPSVKAQTFKDFEWFIFADRAFPGLHNGHIEELKRYGTVIDIDTFWQEQQPEIGHILNHLYRGQWVCSTRLDSDDMLHKSFMERLSKTVTEQEEWVSFEYGYIIEGMFAAKRQYAVNPFVSFVEYADPLRTVFHAPHIAANRTDTPFLTIPEIGWAQIDHGDNIKNHARAKVKDFDRVKILRTELEGFPCT